MLQRPTPIARSHQRLLGCLALISGSVISACSSDRGMADIDARVKRLADERLEAFRAPVGETSRSVPSPTAAADNEKRQYARVTDKAPATTNPVASQLTFNPANEARDVAARLDQYAGSLSVVPEGESARPPMSLGQVLHQVQQAAPEYRSAEEDYIFAAIRLLIERHLWSPRLFNNTLVGVSTQGDDGSFQSAVNVVNNLRVTKRLPYGGEIEARWVWQATEQLRQQSTGRYRQSSEIALAGNIPLLQGAGLVAQESLIQAERDLIYQSRDFEDFRRSFLVDIASDFFNLIQARAQIDNQARQLKSLLLFEQAETARFEAGRIAEFRKNQASNNVLSARADLASLRESYILQLDRFKVRIGFKPEDYLDIGAVDLDLAEPEISPEQASELALTYRLDLQNQRDRLDDAIRGVSNARNALLPSLDLSGRVSLPTDPDAREGGVAPDPDSLSAGAEMNLALPLDRENERLRLRQAQIAVQRAQRNYNRFRDDIAVQARQAVRAIDLARFQLTLAEQRVEINKRRLEELELKADTIDTRTRLDAENELLESENARDRARTALRNSVLDYLLQTGQMRVKQDGTFDPPGAEATMPTPIEPPPPPVETQLP